MLDQMGEYRAEINPQYRLSLQCLQSPRPLVWTLFFSLTNRFSVGFRSVAWDSCVKCWTKVGTGRFYVLYSPKIAQILHHTSQWGWGTFLCNCLFLFVAEKQFLSHPTIEPGPGFTKAFLRNNMQNFLRQTRMFLNAILKKTSKICSQNFSQDDSNYFLKIIS